MSDEPGPRRRARGEIEELPSGSLRVRVYAGIDPVSKRRRYLTRTVPAGPGAAETAETVRAELLDTAGRQHRPSVRAQAGPAAVGSPAARPPAAAPVPQRTGGTAGAERRGRRRGEHTLTTIARLADVSVPTVSKVLNGRSGVAAQTRSRVEALLREHGYRRPELGTPSAIVEVVFYGMQSNLAVAIMHGVEQVAGEHRLAVGFTDARRQLSQGRFWSRDLLARRPTGVIAVHLGFTSEQHALLRASAIPLVVLDPTDELPLHTVPSVTATNWSGGFEAARHLLDLGHRRIAVITGPTERLCARARLDGARAAMEAAGVGLEPRLLRTGTWFSFEDGLSLGQDLLRLNPTPTAVLCGNDLQALGVYEAARLTGRRIPQDLSVVGFDDIPHTRLCGPTMTSVQQPLTDMGAAAARMVLALATNQRLPQTRVELATTLVVRDSTAAPGTW
ncbi:MULTISPECIES: LacI family DNA-binding transcriptional regulator [Micromonospora]|uniref:LacI family DNA-binding transcriptional regulator n=1 Tax=Micromonospora TaxID=1873 RepID=UPI0009E1A87C|nr:MULTISPECIES: LacI family DNA-binding transcriptional regulator [Micromonospora]